MKNPTRPLRADSEPASTAHPVAGRHHTPKFPGTLRLLGFILLVGSVSLVSCQSALHHF